MSSDWQTKRVDELAINRSKRFDIRNTEKAIFINTGDVDKGEFLHNNFTAVEHMPGQARKAIANKDILYSEIRPGNKRYCYVDVKNPEDYVVSTKFMVLETIAEVSSEYLYLVLTSNNCEREFKLIAESRSGTFPQITFDSIGYYPITFPSDIQQNKIVSFLK